MTNKEFSEQELLEILQGLTVLPLPPLVYKLYYDDNGKVITYSTEDLPGQYIEITKEQYAEARHDVIVKAGKIIFTHMRSHVFKLEKSSSGIKCSKYDISIISDTDDNRDSQHWKQVAYEIIR
jgi:hypothetical protein